MQKNILVIEDETDMRDAIAAALKKNGFHVVTAENGKEGVEKAIEFEPDLILLDLLMPIMDGQETLKLIRQHPMGEKTKVIILTAMDDVTNLGNAYETGVSGYIIKSEASLEEIINKVKATLEEA